MKTEWMMKIRMKWMMKMNNENQNGMDDDDE